MTTLEESASGAPSDADFIRQHLATLGLSQREAARQLRIDPRTVRYYCAGQMPVPPAVMLALQQLVDANDRAAQALDIPPALEAEYMAADQSAELVGGLELAGRFNKAIRALGRELRPGEKRGAFALIAALTFISRRRYGEPIWDMHWQPLSTAVDAHGDQHHDPDVYLAGDDTIREWSRRARTSRHPALRARYADVAWEIARFRTKAARVDPEAPGPIRPDVENACLAIDAYLEIVQRRLAQDVFDAVWYLGRALDLAARIRDTDRLHRSKAALFAFRAACDSEGVSYPVWSFDNLLWEQRDALALTPEERSSEIDSLERALARHADPASPQFDPHNAQDAADRLRRWREQTGERNEALRAATTAGAAMEQAAKGAAALTAIAWLSEQHARYSRDGNKASAARVEQEIRRRAPEAHGEMKTVSVPFEVSREEVDAWADKVAGNSLQEGLRNFASAGLIRQKASADRMRAVAEQAPLLANISLSVMRGDGFSSAVVGSVEDDLEGRIVQDAANHASQESPFINVAISRLREKHSLDIDRLMEWLAGSSLFQSRLELTRDGLAAWFQGDFVKAVHVLVPQVEGALRDLLSKIGGSVMVPDPNYGGSQAIPLGAVLNNELFKARVPSDVRFHFRVLYQDVRGINLRNEMSHGLAQAELFGRGTANWVVHSIIMIGLLGNRAGAPSSAGV
jgi:hypothetical protein